MRRIPGLPILVAASLVLGACWSVSVSPDAVSPAPSTVPVTQTPTLSPAIGAATPTPTSRPLPQLPATDQTVLTIPNPEPFAGREGEPRPDWLGWGAETFTIAPDGSFWIADTAVDPLRLLHFSVQGDLLREVSLQDQVAYVFDLAFVQDALWVLDISSQPPKVVQLDTSGEVLSRVGISDALMRLGGEPVSPGVFSLGAGEGGELILSSLRGYFELLDGSGNLSGRPLEALAYYGHTYQVGPLDRAAGRLPVYVDGTDLDLDSAFVFEGDPFIGFYPDGTFAIAGHLRNRESPLDGPVDSLVWYFSPGGELLSSARQRPQIFHRGWNHQLAFGPDGAVYQLVSNPDHSVEIVRLGFSAALPPNAITPTATPTPLIPLGPGTATPSGDSDQDQAREALLDFFTNLSAGRYEAAIGYYSGDIVAELGVRERETGESLEAYWGYICTAVLCLPVAEITAAEQVSETEYRFHVVFALPDGNRFELGPCCGLDSAARPVYWQFGYPVEEIGGVWRVRRGPPFLP